MSGYKYTPCGADSPPKFFLYLMKRMLLVLGDMDDNVHPSMTLLLVDALVQQRKRQQKIY